MGYVETLKAELARLYPPKSGDQPQSKHYINADTKKRIDHAIRRLESEIVLALNHDEMTGDMLYHAAFPISADANGPQAIFMVRVLNVKNPCELDQIIEALHKLQQLKD